MPQQTYFYNVVKDYILNKFKIYLSEYILRSDFPFLNLLSVSTHFYDVVSQVRSHKSVNHVP